MEDGIILMSKNCIRINRNDMLELTRRMTLSRNCFMRAAGAYIDEDGFIDNTFNVNFKNMGKHDQQVNLDLAKTIPTLYIIPKPQDGDSYSYLRTN